jgi:hypothetical protein
LSFAGRANVNVYVPKLAKRNQGLKRIEMTAELFEFEKVTKNVENTSLFSSEAAEANMIRG